MNEAQKVIQKLKLEPLQSEGGFFRRSYESSHVFIAKQAPYNGEQRLIGTAIYYLITPVSYSRIHRVKCDELFHFYAGNSVLLSLYDNTKKPLERIRMGSDVISGERPQVLVPAGQWQGLKLVEGGEWALLGTTCFPGFEYEDFEMGE